MKKRIARRFGQFVNPESREEQPLELSLAKCSHEVPSPLSRGCDTLSPVVINNLDISETCRRKKSHGVPIVPTYLLYTAARSLRRTAVSIKNMQNILEEEYPEPVDGGDRTPPSPKACVAGPETIASRTPRSARSETSATSKAQQPRVRAPDTKARTSETTAATPPPAARSRLAAASKFLRRAGISPRYSTTDYADPRVAAPHSHIFDTQMFGKETDPLAERARLSPTRECVDSIRRRDDSITWTSFEPPPKQQQPATPPSPASTCSASVEHSASSKRASLSPRGRRALSARRSLLQASPLSPPGGKIPRRKQNEAVIPTHVGWSSSDLTPEEVELIREAGNPAEDFARYDITPFKIVRFTQSRDEFVFATSILGDRVVVYINRERAEPLRRAGILFPGVPIEDVGDFQIEEETEAVELGAERMSWIAGVCAELCRHGTARGLLSGALAASATLPGDTVCDEVISRYFAAMYSGNNLDQPLFAFAHSRAAQYELRASKADEVYGGVFARATAVIPILHSALLVGPDRVDIHTITEVIHETTPRMERIYLEASASELAKIARKDTESITARIDLIASTVPEVIRIKNEAANRNIQYTNEHDCDTSERLFELSQLTSRVGDIFGNLWSELDIELAALKRSLTVSLSEIYVEIRNVFAPRPEDVRYARIFLAENWGLPKTVNSFDFSCLNTPLPLSDGDSVVNAFNEAVVNYRFRVNDSNDIRTE